MGLERMRGRAPIEAIINSGSLPFYKMAAVDIGGVDVGLAPVQRYNNGKPLPEDKVRIRVINENNIDLGPFWRKVEALKKAVATEQSA